MEKSDSKETNSEEESKYKNWVKWHEVNYFKMTMPERVTEKWDELKKKFVGLTSAQALELAPNAIISSHRLDHKRLGVKALNKLFLICNDDEGKIIKHVCGYWVPFDMFPNTYFVNDYWSCSSDFDESKAPRRLLDFIEKAKDYHSGKLFKLYVSEVTIYN